MKNAAFFARKRGPARQPTICAGCTGSAMRRSWRAGWAGFPISPFRFRSSAFSRAALTSFHLGFCSVGGASIGLGWPICCLFSLASRRRWDSSRPRFQRPAGSTTGHRFWAGAAGAGPLPGSISRGWSPYWLRSTSGAYSVRNASFLSHRTAEPDGSGDHGRADHGLSQALFNHLGIRVTRVLIDFSGYLILVASIALTVVSWCGRRVRAGAAHHVHQFQRRGGR